MDELLITTVIPTYRRPAMLRQAIASALRQTWPHVLVRVYDNASGDETEDVVARISETDARVLYHRHPENIGAYENFNFGVKEVESPLFSLLSDDDVLLPGFYEQAIGAFREHSDAMFVAMPTLEVDDTGSVIGGSRLCPTSGKRYYHAGEAFDGMWNGSVPSIWTGYVFRREVIEGIGFVKISAGPAADVAFIRHVLARYPGVVVPYLAGLLRVHPDSYSVNMQPLIKMNRSFWKAQAEGIENDEKVPAPIRSKVYFLIERMYVKGINKSVVSSLIDGRLDCAMEAILKLKNMGYRVAANLFRGFMFCYRYLPLVSYTLHKIALLRRNRHKNRLMEINRQYESQREEFKDLLQVSSESFDGHCVR